MSHDSRRKQPLEVDVIPHASDVPGGGIKYYVKIYGAPLAFINMRGGKLPCTFIDDGFN